MWIVQKPFFDQFFIVASSYLFFQERKGFQLLHIIKWTVLVIQPGIHDIQSVHQSLGEHAVIGFPVTEFHIVDAGQNGLFIQPLFCLVLQHFVNFCHKSVCLVRICIFSFYGKNRLSGAAVVAAVNVFSKACIQKCLL